MDVDQATYICPRKPEARMLPGSSEGTCARCGAQIVFQQESYDAARSASGDNTLLKICGICGIQEAIEMSAKGHEINHVLMSTVLDVEADSWTEKFEIERRAQLDSILKDI